uniref:Transmembrane protein 19 n=2 Tax=Cacopsylla melanoneura TaxID=428564 RepID=A0A8D8TA40_9HEMI
MPGKVSTSNSWIPSSKWNTAIPIIIIVVTIPLSMLFWLGNLALSFMKADTNATHIETIAPTRWLAATFIPIVIAIWGLRRKSLTLSGALLGLVVGFVLTISSYGFLSCLMVFFITSSRVTKFRSNIKQKIEEDFKEGGQRNWVQVLCNGGMATQLAVFYILDAGCGEKPIDFVQDYRSSWLALGILGAFSCCNGDTWASEIGTVMGSTQPYLITSFRKVPRGTNGGVSPIGLLVSLGGGLVVGVAYYVSIIYMVDPSWLASSPSQWPVIPICGLSGLVGSIIDSVLGATVQYSGFDESRKVVVSQPGPGVKHISGRKVLDNDSVNLLSSIFTGLITSKLASYVWSQ